MRPQVNCTNYQPMCCLKKAQYESAEKQATTQFYAGFGPYGPFIQFGPGLFFGSPLFGRPFYW